MMWLCAKDKGRKETMPQEPHPRLLTALSTAAFFIVSVFEVRLVLKQKGKVLQVRVFLLDTRMHQGSC